MTPLFRAVNLEKALGLKKIYLKLEGTNAFGHLYDRLSAILLGETKRQKKAGIITSGTFPIVNSMVRFANSENIQVYIPFDRGNSIKSKIKGSFTPLTIPSPYKDKNRSFIEDYARKNNLFNACSGFKNINTTILAFEEIGDEIYTKLTETVTDIFIQVTYGYTLTGIYNSFERKRIKGEIQNLPRLISCTIPEGNKFYNMYKKRDYQETKLMDTAYDTFTANTSLNIEDNIFIHSVLDAVYDTDGLITGVESKSLADAVSLLKHKEDIIIRKEEAYSIAGFIDAVRSGTVSDGIHVIVLNDGRSRIVVNPVEMDDYSDDELYCYVDTFLREYSDSEAEIKDAIRNARKHGRIFLAFIAGEVKGIAVVVNTGFTDFIPAYHLAYIGTGKGSQGRGIATELFKEVLAFTKENVSLHVEAANHPAIKVYEKLGFVYCYKRMIYDYKKK